VSADIAYGLQLLWKRIREAVAQILCHEVSRIDDVSHHEADTVRALPRLGLHFFFTQTVQTIQGKTGAQIQGCDLCHKQGIHQLPHIHL
jgi:hypothetical protein